ncbi:hypothetical protein A6U87_12220 [Rhizobium sp. AC44/96]|uniref:hypothetical protein n=1 Tax=Rhizobium sp. AC44/96 TaxID=1841654 RepID=UPI00080FF36D|nr:hypothetical protein [Rhizobium sp. AC44/96]OCJ08013.1 hypothetical protein A6U87_12220 [Rhizobium sp. AC44/96]
MPSSTSVYYQPDFDYRADAEVLNTAHQLVDLYLCFVKDSDVGGDLVDEIELPLEKATFVEAFRLLIAAELRADVRSLLIRAGMTLAQYHRGLGSRIRMRALTPQGRPSFSRLHGSGARRRLEKTLVASAEERIRLEQVFERAHIEAMH